MRGAIRMAASCPIQRSALPSMSRMQYPGATPNYYHKSRLPIYHPSLSTLAQGRTPCSLGPAGRLLGVCFDATSFCWRWRQFWTKLFLFVFHRSATVATLILQMRLSLSDRAGLEDLSQEECLVQPLPSATQSDSICMRSH